MTTTTTVPSPTIREILAAGQCTPSCILSQDTGRCRCACTGEFHGAALAAAREEHRNE